MRGHDRTGLHQRDLEDYEQEDYDEYEEEASEPEGDIEQEEVKPTKGVQEFLKLREQLKDGIRQKLKKQSGSASSHLSKSQDNKRTVTNDKFGSFFGPYQPVIASRVIEESRSIRETRHIMAKVPSSSSGQNSIGSVSSSTEVKKHELDRQEKDVKEIKNKARALKDMRDYSFLLSDDADFPAPEIEQPAPRKVSALNSDGRSVQAPLKSKIPTSNTARLVSNGHQLKNSASSSQHKQLKVGSSKEASMSRPKPAPAISRKGVSVGTENGRSQLVGPKHLPPKVTAQAKATSKPPAKSMDHPSLNKKPSSAKAHSSIQNHYPEEKKATKGPDKGKTISKQPLPSSKVQPSKQVAPRGIHEDRPKKRPAKWDDEDDDADAIQMIRSMFGYNPNRYARIDDQDDSDMEAGFDDILEEERKSTQIARKEDEEQLRLIEEEERRERMRKKRKMASHR